MNFILSSEEKTLNHWSTVQFFFSSAYAPDIFSGSGLTQRVQHLQSIPQAYLCMMVHGALTPASVHSLWISPKFFALSYTHCYSSGLCTFFYHTFPSQPASHEYTLIQFWTDSPFSNKFCALPSTTWVLMVVP